MDRLFKRKQKDVADLLCHVFDRPSARLVCRDVCGTADDVTIVEFCVCIYEGVYKGGHFVFKMSISEQYPFIGPDVISCHPLWHPNIDIRTGAVRLSATWSPILSLISMATSVLEILLAPNVEFNSNAIAAKSYTDNIQLFGIDVQVSLRGGVFRNVYFPPCQLGCYYCSSRDYENVSRKRQRSEVDIKYAEDGSSGMDVEHEMTGSATTISSTERVSIEGTSNGCPYGILNYINTDPYCYSSLGTNGGDSGHLSLNGHVELSASPSRRKILKLSS